MYVALPQVVGERVCITYVIIVNIIVKDYIEQSLCLITYLDGIVFKHQAL